MKRRVVRIVIHGNSLHLFRNSKVAAEVRTPFFRFHFSLAYRPFPAFVSSHAFPRLNGNSKFRPSAASLRSR